MPVEPMEFVKVYEAMDQSMGGVALKDRGFWPAWAANVPGGFHWTNGTTYVVRDDFKTREGMSLEDDVYWWRGESIPEDCLLWQFLKML